MPGIEFTTMNKTWVAAIYRWKTGLDPVVNCLLADAEQFRNLRNIIRVGFPDFAQIHFSTSSLFHSAYSVGYSDVDVKRLDATQASRSATVYTTRRPSLLYAGPVP
jgi:hypothetical protein